MSRIPPTEGGDAGTEQAPYSPTDYVALFFDLFETSSDAVYITRVGDGVLLDANDSALSLFGYMRTEAIGHSTQELGLWANLNDRQAFLDAMKRQGRLRRYAVRFRTKWSENSPWNSPRRRRRCVART